MSAPRGRGSLFKLVVLVALGLALQPLSACAELELGAEAAKRISRSASVPAAADGTQVAQATAQSAVSRYLKAAPQIFEATGTAVWDGKRTLQGVWVAHPLASSARRVRIFNTTNGLAVDGALFKRDSALSGASVLISSEAAGLLQMAAGEEARLRIVAVTPIRRPDPADETTTAPATPVVQPGVATAEPTKPAPTTAPSTPEATPEPVEPTTAVTKAEPVPPPSKPVDEASVVTSSPVTVAPKATPPEPVVPEPIAKTPDQPAFRWETATPDPATSTQIAVEPSDQPLASTQTSTGTGGDAPPDAQSGLVEASPTPKPAPKAPAVVASTLSRPFVQAGVFGVAANAADLVRKLKGTGMPALGKTVKSGDRTLTRVLAGPFASTSERDQAQAVIRKMGLRDAAPVKR